MRRNPVPTCTGIEYRHGPDYAAGRAQPQLPTVAESGVPGFSVNIWTGMLAPAEVPREIVTRGGRQLC